MNTKSMSNEFIISGPRELSQKELQSVNGGAVGLLARVVVGVALALYASKAK